jgi:hypothetical protein
VHRIFLCLIYVIFSPELYFKNVQIQRLNRLGLESGLQLGLGLGLLIGTNSESDKFD